MRKTWDKINFLDVGACFLIFIAPFLNFLEYTDYPLLTGETFVILMGFFFLSFLLFAFVSIQSYLLRCLLYTIIITVTLDFSSVSFLPGMVGKFATFLSVLVLFLFLWGFRKNMAVLLLVMFLSVNVATFAVPLVNQLSSLEDDINTVALADSEALPNIVHLYLDEHIGIEGIPQDLHNGKALAQELKDFYRANDFQTFGGAHSSYYRSAHSIAALLNFNNSPLSVSENIIQKDDQKNQQHYLSSNAYFKNLSEQGYVINVYQSDYMGFCDPLYVRVNDCHVYPQSSIDKDAVSNLKTFEKVRLLCFTFAMSQKFIKQSFLALYKLSQTIELPALFLPNKDFFSNVGTMSILTVMDKISDDINQHKGGGQLYFAHLLIPHHPYIWDEQCQLIEPIYSWESPVIQTDLSVQEAYMLSKTRRAELHQEYFKQISCAKLKLQNLFTQMKNSGIFENTIIILHSDHGSRITENGPVYSEKHTVLSRDIQDGFSTLFAIKMPGEAASYDPDITSINKIFFKYMGKGVEQTDTHEGEVFFEVLGADVDELSRDHWKRVKIETPRSQPEQ